jgi:peptidoglycan/LPS O-acetylase OafA/YrhL
VTAYWIHSPINLFADVLLAGCTLSLSFSFIGLGQFFLKGNDISYGLYIYHMLVINFLVQRNLLGEDYFLFVVIIVTIILASISWLLVEKKALESKNAIAKAIISMLPKHQQGT